MNPKLPILLVLVVMTVTCAHGLAGEPDINICKGKYRINAYLEIAAALEAMPKAKAIALLQKWAQTSNGSIVDDLSKRSDYEMDVIILTRMLFTENPLLKCKFTADGAYTGEIERSHPLRRPGIGGTFFIGGPSHIGAAGGDDPDGSKDRAMYARTLDPIVLIKNIPLLVTTGGYSSSGPRPETAAEYLNYCIGSGVWGKIPYQKATKEQMEETIRKYQKNIALRPLNQEEIEILRDQMVEPQVPKPKSEIKYLSVQAVRQRL